MQNQEEKSKIKTGEEETKLVMLQNILELQSRCSFFLLPVQTKYLLREKKICLHLTSQKKEKRIAILTDDGLTSRRANRARQQNYFEQKKKKRILSSLR